MFAQVIADFEDRVSEIDLYFQLLSSLDNEELVIRTGIGPQVLPVGEVPADWDSMLKGSAYLVLYNLVEAFIRRGFQEVFDLMSADGLSGIDLTDTLREQWIMQRNRRVSTFDGSPKVYMEIAFDLIGDIIDKNIVQLHRDHLPVSGNLDGDTIRELFARHGVSYSTSPQARGGTSLALVKVKRNALSHGNESFAECGRQTTVADLAGIKNEVIMFMREILNNLDTFATSKQYRATAPAAAPSATPGALAAAQNAV